MRSSVRRGIVVLASLLAVAFFGPCAWRSSMQRVEFAPPYVFDKSWTEALAGHGIPFPTGTNDATKMVDAETFRNREKRQ